MKTRLHICLLAFFAALTLTAGCGSETEKKSIAPGSYEISNHEISQDECSLGEDLNGVTLEISITDTTLTLGAAPELTLYGDSVSGSRVTSHDWTPDHDCVESTTFNYTGTVSGKNKLDLAVSTLKDVVTGEGCSEANGGLTFPCTTTESFRLTLTPED